VILGIIGGALLAIGSFLTWVTVTVNVNAFAGLLGVDPSLLTGAGVPSSASNAGIKTSDGKITLVAGIVVLVVAGMLAMGKRASKAAGTAMLIAGGVGTAATVLNLATKDSQIDSELDKLGPQLTTLGITKDALKSIFEQKWGIGIYVCLLGGVVALVAGIMALRTPAEAQPMAMSAPAPAGGFGAPPPAAPMPPSTPAPTESLPTSEPMPPTPPEGPPSSTP
jgi:hypothetical protein